MDKAVLSKLIPLLRETVVAITHGDSPGTGFFIARDTVLTCAHVLEMSQEPIKVRWHGEEKDATVNRLGNVDDLDLAVLHIEDGWKSHPFVLLGTEVELGNSFYAFGHPVGPYREGGDSATFVYEGPAYPGSSGREAEIWKFKQGEAEPGMSGSPMLNQETGTVSAVISINRKRDTDLGARGFPIGMLEDFYPSMLRLNREQETGAWKECVQKMTPAKAAKKAVASSSADLQRKLEETEAQRRTLEAEDARQRRNARHQADINRYGFYAEEFVIEKVLNNDGSSQLRYQVKNLTVKRGQLKGMRSAFESMGGCVGFPELDSSTKQQQISWTPESQARYVRLPIAEKLENVRQVAGAFGFDTPLKPDDPPLSIGWSFTVVNGDALSDWEFEHLYSESQRLHIDDHRLNSPMEYFARIVWFPTKRLTIRLTLPSRITTTPRLSVFQCADRVDVPESEVVKDGIAQSYPNAGSGWVKTNVKWQRDRRAELAEAAGLTPGQEAGSFELIVEQPPVGWSYSLDWLLPRPKFTAEFDSLIDRTEEVRCNLLQYRLQCDDGNLDEPGRKVQELFAEFSREVQDEYQGRNGKGAFGVTLLTYEKQLHRLVVVEGFNGGDPCTPAKRQFWLPFGMGIAGACFRNGIEALCYLKPSPLSNAADYFLSLTETPDNEILIAVPVDNRDFTEPIYSGVPDDRNRQLIAIVTLSSTRRTGGLRQLTVETEKISRLRTRCQRLGDDITALVQPGN